jgi:hypothetical protein
MGMPAFFHRNDLAVIDEDELELVGQGYDAAKLEARPGAADVANGAGECTAALIEHNYTGLQLPRALVAAVLSIGDPAGWDTPS